MEISCQPLEKNFGMRYALSRMLNDFQKQSGLSQVEKYLFTVYLFVINIRQTQQFTLVGIRNK